MYSPDRSRAVPSNMRYRAIQLDRGHNLPTRRVNELSRDTEFPVEPLISARHSPARRVPHHRPTKISGNRLDKPQPDPGVGWPAGHIRKYPNLNRRRLLEPRQHPGRALETAPARAWLGSEIHWRVVASHGTGIYLSLTSNRVLCRTNAYKEHPSNPDAI